MALLMEAGSEPITENEKADLDALTAIKESTAIELKEEGNRYVKMGKKHYTDAIDCYTRAINQRVLTDAENSIIFSNRAHVNLLLGNFRRALEDAEEAVKLCPTNIKALYRAAKAAYSLGLLSEATSFCQTGLKQFPSNEEIKKLKKQIDSQKLELEQREQKVLEAVAKAKDVASAIENRGWKLGKPMYQQLTGIRKPILDKNNILHWPVVLLYAEVMSSDIIEDFCETDMFSVHLDMMFSESYLPLPWDKEHSYTREAVELYYEAGSGINLSKTEVLRHLLEGTAGALVENIRDEEAQESSNNSSSSGSKSEVKWVKVNEKKTLHEVLKQSDYIIPGIPVFYVVSKHSSFYKDFRAGKWASP